MAPIRRMTISVLLTTALSIGVGANVARAGNLAGYAWGENTGWINFNPSQGPGVTVTDSQVTGYAWGENVGWINLSPATGGVANDGVGHLSGYAWGANVGWINFAPIGGGVTIDPLTGEFSGFAWGENIGWISVASTGPVLYGITTSWTGCVSADCAPTPSATPSPTATSTATHTPVPNGGGCTGSTQCQSGYCVDGVCCDTPCEHPFEQCNLPGRAGTCSSVAPVPAMSVRGLILASLLIAGVAALAIARRRPRAPRRR